jgi:hypothetical protein
MDPIWRALPQKHKKTLERVYIQRKKVPYLQLERDQQQSKHSEKEIVDGGHERLCYFIQGACW